MMFVCPYCGIKLKTYLSDGITSCLNCNRTFDSSLYHKLLSASWYARNYHLDIETVKSNYKLSDQEAEIVEEHGYSHESFIKAIDKLGISKLYSHDA